MPEPGKPDRPRILRHTQPFVSIVALTIQQNPPSGPSLTQTLNAPFQSSSVNVLIPLGGDSVVTVKVSSRGVPQGYQIIALLTDQNAGVGDDYTDYTASTCDTSYSCFTFTLTNTNKLYDLDVRIVKTSDMSQILVNKSGPILDT